MPMKDDTSVRTYFWPYDIFGYLLPGFFFIAILYKTNTFIGANLKSLFHPNSQSSEILNILIIIAISYIMGHLISALSSFFLEKVFVGMLLKYPTANLLDNARSNASRLLAGPLNYFRPYKEDFRKKLIAKFESRFGITYEDENDLWQLVWTYITMYHPAAFKRGTHYLELYGFTRNISWSLVLISLLPLFPNWNEPICSWIWFGVAFGSAVLMFLNYLKLFRRMNDEMYRAFYMHTVTSSLTNRASV